MCGFVVVVIVVVVLFLFCFAALPTALIRYFHVDRTCALISVLKETGFTDLLHTVTGEADRLTFPLIHSFCTVVNFCLRFQERLALLLLVFCPW